MAPRRRRSGRRRPPPRPGPRGGKNAERKLLDETTRHAVAVERTKAGEAKRAADPWRDITDDIVAEVVSRIESLRESGRLTARDDIVLVVQREVTRRVAEILETAKVASQGVISGGMVRLARIEAVWTIQVTEPTLPLGVSMRMPPLDQLRGCQASARWRKFGGDTQRPLQDWMEGIQKSARAKVRSAVGEALRTGTPTPEVTRQLRQITDLSARQAEAVARTGFAHASSVGTQLVAEENPELVIGVLWVSTLDSRTTIQCAALDGKVFRVDEGPRPPIHFGERSRVSLLTRDPADIVAGKTGKPTDEELAAAAERRTGGTRAAIDYKTGRATRVPARESYGDYLRRQPATVQDDVLGRTRARAFRRGEIEIEQFVGKDYQTLLLDDLAQRYGISLDA